MEKNKKEINVFNEPMRLPIDSMGYYADFGIFHNSPKTRDEAFSDVAHGRKKRKKRKW